VIAVFDGQDPPSKEAERKAREARREAARIKMNISTLDTETRLKEARKYLRLRPEDLQAINIRP